MEKPQPPDNLWEKLDAAKREIVPECPSGSFTVQDYRTRYGIPRATAQDQLQKLCASGKVERSQLGRRVYYKMVG
ncbi:hypothetical protein LCGC14_1360200 [marine sediment metagenome]|uniref:HTH arsR-type domain-containing protein n=1 Tax=marine sediment metagenome TaxID=412755 RepID=A0A0F9K8X9_9ZZZZ